MINPTTIERYRWLVYDVSPDLDQLHTTDQYSVSLFHIYSFLWTYKTHITHITQCQGHFVHTFW